MVLTRALARFFTNYEDPNSFVARMRARRIGPLVQLIQQTHEIHGAVSIIDVGGTDVYWNIGPRDILKKYKVRITLVNLPDGQSRSSNEFFEFAAADGCDLSQFADKAFHIGHSNSVVEHVGDWARMKQFAAELDRVSQKWFVQTPSYWFPIEPHAMCPLLHWLPKPWRVGLVRSFQLGHWKKAASVDEAVSIVESARLLDRAMFESLFAKAECRVERFFGWPKSYIGLCR